MKTWYAGMPASGELQEYPVAVGESESSYTEQMDLDDEEAYARMQGRQLAALETPSGAWHGGSYMDAHQGLVLGERYENYRQLVGKR
jgi:hypothetical protein